MRLCLLALLALAAPACKAAATVVYDCNNNLKDGHETDVDCGGPMCGPCGTARHCKSNHDCIAKLCNSDGVCSAAGCSDGIINGSETDVDCGGPDCPPCMTGRVCYAGSDCLSRLCESDAGVCD